jgi:shikimate dehydrogenase
MKGFPKVSMLPRKPSPGAWAFDLIYRPERTVFLEAARRRGLKTVGGLDMLLWQALATWEIWFGPLVNESRLFKGLKAELSQELHR